MGRLENIMPHVVKVSGFDVILDALPPWFTLVQDDRGPGLAAQTLGDKEWTTKNPSGL